VVLVSMESGGGKQHTVGHFDTPHVASDKHGYCPG
jgi:hypothetical protein